MIAKLIAWCIDNRFLVMILTTIAVVIGLWSTYTIPVDAIPDLSDVQVIIYTPWQGRDPQTMEDQVTYPLARKMLSVPGVSDVRGYSFFGFSFVYVIFEDGTDMYWARSRVLEYMNEAQGELPPGATPRLGPDATGLGWVYIYTLEDTENKHDLGELRAIQDWYVRYQLASVPGVSEVATVGGAVRQYQVEVDPRKLLFYQIPLQKVMATIKDSNNDVGGRVVEMAETEHMIRGRGYIRGKKDLEKIVLSATEDGTPVLLSDVAEVQIGPDMKRGVAEKNGQGEVVAGVVVMRFGENALKVIEDVKAKIEEIEPGLPEGVRIRTAYDRSGLIHRSIDTLKETLAEELAITAIICLIFLLHVRSGLVAAAVLPLGILLAFIVMKLCGINANIMSISGIAVAIGTMVDSSIVMVENLHKHKEHNPDASHWEQVKVAAQEVGPGLFVALLVITVSFLPVFALEGQAGRLFKPLAFTKTFAMAAGALIAVMVIPSLMGFFVRGKTPTEDRNPVNRFCIWLYMPFIRFALRHKLISMAGAFLLLGITIVPWTKIGSEFMPPLREGDILFMPTTVPGISVTEARRTLQIQDQLLMQFPEVKVALGKIGRSTTPTDPAPLAMVETHASLRPEEEWPKRLIEKGYLQGLAAQMVNELRGGGDFLAKTVKELEIATVAEQAEGMTRAEINRQTRMELVERMNSGMEKLREGLEAHREAALKRGDPVRSRFSEEQLEEEWAGDLLQHEMERIRPRLPERIAEQLPRNLVDILESQGGISADRKEAAVAHLREQWSGRITTEDIPFVKTTFAELTKDEMHKAITIPGMPNWWLMPIETRIGMLTTGMRGLLGVKVYGTDLEELERVGLQLEAVLKEVPGTTSVVAERPMGGHYLDIEVDRDACARYGLKVGDVQRMIESAIGGMNIDMTVEGRFRFPISVRYPRELRDDPEKLKRIFIAAPAGPMASASDSMTMGSMSMGDGTTMTSMSQSRLIPLGQVARIEIADGPPMIKSEAGMLLINIPVDIEEGLDIGTYVKNAQAEIDRARTDGRLAIPPGYHLKWSGQFEFMEEVRQRLNIIIPITLALIFILIYFNMKNITETLITMVTLPFALIGGVWGMYWLGYNWSVAVAIGFIALAGLAAETGIIMHVYLDLAYKKHRREMGRPLTAKELYDAVIEGAVLRVRPKLMTVLTDFIALMPILWATTPGAGPMKRIAVPVIFGVITSAVHTLVLIPVYYTLYKRWEQWKESRRNHDRGGAPHTDVAVDPSD
ncbi:MAG: AcrB/AcrD/AcrF family protein [Planctomycetota bacterium]|nr:MAG: AcrB/AcrD/AcrF family protein [Planctomycetota bacterium]REJ92109.1 MAG: AcrB/AcrD/AcrF family protein [Planctomycetota bacterium]REK28645.1 MAG: AcrB/AcrD/AcrF family protein [Planctomycetota bacterium]REK39259.1 MAG: AcrB/AcrD/AcrF family protein [Planctomycetota bacterium]